MQLDELAVNLGWLLNVEITGQDYKRHHCQAKLVGYQSARRIFIELMNKPPQILLHQGLKVSVQVPLALGVANFETLIEGFEKGDSGYLVLAAPEDINMTTLRQGPRIPVDEPIEIIGQTALGMSTSSLHGYILDISQQGACIVVEKELTKMVTEVTLGVCLSIDQLTRDMNLPAKLSRRLPAGEKYPDYNFSYGLSFLNVADIDQYFLAAFCQGMLLKNNQVLCSLARK